MRGVGRGRRQEEEEEEEEKEAEEEEVNGSGKMWVKGETDLFGELGSDDVMQPFQPRFLVTVT